ncbi:MAG: hypothetical protein JSU70_04415 [Phycisphaerales bacterium]|nr:MAG: hypothetical protein JSU70_04415 [Phycisphaerales bacterium]
MRGLLIAMVTLVVTVSAEARYGGGSGTAEDPYQIWTAEQMNAIGAEPNDWDKHFMLMVDIDLGAYTGTQFNLIGSWFGWEHPDNRAFTGVFDGNGKTIRNFTWESDGQERIGLFRYFECRESDWVEGEGWIEEGGLIKDLGLIDVYVSDPNSIGPVGSLVAVHGGEIGHIADCYATGTVTAPKAHSVGGLIGVSETLEGCRWQGTVIGLENVGGLVGWHEEDMKDCFASGHVHGVRAVGGLVGYADEGDVNTCKATCVVEGQTRVGGLMGEGEEAFIFDCYALGHVSGGDYVGGLVGFHRRDGNLERCFSAAKVEGIGGDIGGLIGGSSGAVGDSFWDVEVSGQAQSAGGAGLPTAEMQTADTFLDAGWDFVNVWGIGENQTYPYLRKYSATDINQDRVVDWLDFALLASHWASYPDVTRDTALTITLPMPYERFVVGEEVKFMAVELNGANLDGSQLSWRSSLDGDLGNGMELTASSLSAGDHLIEVYGYGASDSISIRVYEDLWQLYQSPPADGEVTRIMSDFTINQIDGKEADEQWDLYGPVFDQSSTDPSLLVAIAKIDVLRHQRFADPVPFTDGKTLYDHFKTHVKTINLKLDCGYNTGGGDRVNLSRSFSVWDGRMSGTSSNWDACKTPFANPTLYKYTSPLYLLLHECRHCEPDDPGHTSCDGRAKDLTLENGSGYAQATLYLMWVYKYSLYDPPSIRSEAGSTAASFLERFLCTPPTHSDPKVQAIIDELLGTGGPMRANLLAENWLRDIEP